MSQRAVAVVAAVIATLPSAIVSATAALAPVDQQTITGVWESIDWESGTFFRLEVEKAGVILAVSNGSPPLNAAYQLSAITVKAGSVTMSGIEKSSGVRIAMSGKGRASGDIGVLRVKLETSNGFIPSWNGAELVFLKREKASRVGRLLEAEVQTARLTRGTSAADASRDSTTHPNDGRSRSESPK